MQAIVLEQPGKFVRAEVGEPDRPGPGEALVRVRRVGVCGTDFSAFLGKMPLFRYPRIPGHELGVEVAEVGPGVSNVRPGDRCSVEPYLNCGECHPCRLGKGNCCEQLEVLGVHIDGGLRARFLLPARKLHPSRTLTFEQLALVETLAIGAHAVARAKPEKDSNLLIVGAGPIGLSVLEFARLAGARVTMADVSESRLAFSRDTLNVDRVIRIGDAPLGALYGTVIDATGNAKSMARSFDYAAHGGTVVFVGITPEDVPLADPLFHRKEITLCGSRNALPTDFAAIIRGIEEGTLNTQPWITHRTAFRDFVETFPSYTRPETGVLKAIVEVE